jgi:hypothetical protein
VRVRVGWSGEIDSRWQKADIELEEDDLQRMFYAADLPVDHHWNMSTRCASTWLKNEAEVLLLSKLVGQGYPADKAAARQQVLEEQTAALLGRVRESLSKVDA